MSGPRRYTKYWWVGGITLLVGLIFAVVTSAWLSHPHPGSQWTESNGAFMVRVRRQGTFDFNYRYIFDTRRSESDDWRAIYETLIDEPGPVSKKSATIVRDDAAYFIFGPVVATSTDYGESWTFFDISRDSKFGLERIRSGWSAEVELRPDGSGTIRIQVHYPKGRVVPVFRTNDFGKTWAEMYPGREVGGFLGEERRRNSPPR